MKFSTRTTYGLRALIRLGRNYNQGSVSLASISREEKISLKYLERLFSELKKAGLVEAQIGMSGGYKLTKSPAKTSVYDIVKTLEGEVNPFYCVDFKGNIKCAKQKGCGATIVLKKVQTAVTKTLARIKLSDLL